MAALRKTHWSFLSARALAAAALGIGSIGLLGWILDSDALKSFLASSVTLKTNAALCFLFCGAALWISSYEDARRWQMRSARGLAAGAAALGALTLTEHIFGVNLGIDQLLFAEHPGATATASPNRMGPPASLCFALSGAALLLLDSGPRWQRLLAQFLGLLTCAIVSVPLMGYFYGIETLYSRPRITGIAPHTAFGLLFVGAGIVLSRPRIGVMLTLCALDAGGAMARRLILPSIFLPFVVWWLRLAAERLGWFDATVGRPLAILLLSICSAVAILINARSISRTATALRRSEREREQQAVRTNEILESLSDGFYAINAEGRFSYINGHAEALWQRPGASSWAAPSSPISPASPTPSMPPRTRT